MQAKPSAGAARAAERLLRGMGRSPSLERIELDAQIIDQETHLKELVEAVEYLIDHAEEGPNWDMLHKALAKTKG